MANKKTTTDNAVRSLLDAKRSAEALHEAEAEFRQRHRALTKERRRTAYCPPAEAEVLASMEEVVDRAAAKWREVFGPSTVRHIGGHFTTSGDASSREVWHRPALPLFGPKRDLTLEDMCGLDPEGTKQRLAVVIMASGARFGLPRAERAARLRELDAEIAQVEESHTELVDSAAKAGLVMELLEPVRIKRELDADREKRRLEYDRQQDEAKRRGQPPPQPVHYVTG